MSISTSGGGAERQPSTVKVDKTTGAGKPPAGKKAAGARPAGKGPQGKGGGKGRKPITPVKVSGGRNWGPIAVAGAVVLIALGIIGVGVFYTVRSENAGSWEEQAADIDGIVNYRETDPKLVEGSQHQAGPIQYTILPPVAGQHNAVIQTCMGNVYDAPIANEHAVHSLEHGAVWITYKLGLPAADVEKLAAKVQGREKMMMSPVEGLSSNVSLQAWGYQLKVDTVDDERIDQFIRALRVNASIEGATAPCDGGVTTTGTTPAA